MITEKSFSNYIDLIMTYIETINTISMAIGLADTSPLIQIERNLIDLIVSECEIAPPSDESNPDYWAWNPLIIQYLNYRFSNPIQDTEPDFDGTSETPSGFIIKTIPQPSENEVSSEEQIPVEPTIWNINTSEDLYKLLVDVYQNNHIIINEE